MSFLFVNKFYLHLLLQKKKVNVSKNKDITNDSNRVLIKKKKNSVRHIEVSLKNKNIFLESNKITNNFKNKIKDNITNRKTTFQNNNKLHNHKSYKDKKLQTVKIQPKKNKHSKKQESNIIVQENTNKKNNKLQKKQKFNLIKHSDTECTDLLESIKSPKKRKANGTIVNRHMDTSLNIKVKDLDLDKADELMINAKKKKLNEVHQQEDKEDELFPHENKKRVNLKKQKIKQMLDKNDVNRNSIKVNGNDLRTRMLERLKGIYLIYIDPRNAIIKLLAYQNLMAQKI